MTTKNNTQVMPRTGYRSLLRCATALLGAVAIAGTGSALAADGDVTYQTNGVGVNGATNGGQVPAQINHASDTGETEAISFDLGAEATSATAEVSNLFSNEFSGERGQWEAFNGFGEPVGDEPFILPADENVGNIEITPTEGPFRYLVFTALPFDPPADTNDSSDYFVRSITYTLDEFDAEAQTIGGTEVNTDPEAWSDLNPTGFALGVSYLDGDNFIGAEPVIVNTEECSGDGDDNGDCIVELTDDFTLIVQNAPDVQGSFTAGVQTIVDPRASCGNIVEAGTNDTLDLGFDLGDGKTGPIIPAHLCGTPNPAFEDRPTFELININSQLTVVRSVLDLIADNEISDEYNCLADDKSKRPVVAWLPKTSNPEIPVLDAGGELVDVIQDVTVACGSSRGRTSRFSYVAYDLRHIENAPYVDIIGTAIAQLNATIQQSDACVDKIENKAVKSRAKSGANAFDTQRYSTAKRQYIKLLDTVSNDIHYEQCLFDLDNGNVFVGDPASPGEGNLPRNFRGDLIVQIQHILYMIDRMLDETSPALPEF